MKAHLLYQDLDLDLGAALPPGHEDLIADLELGILLDAMAQGDEFLYGIARRVLLTGLHEPAAIRYRQQVLADCIAEPKIIRQLYDIAVGALADRRRAWGYFSASSPGSTLSAAVSQLELLTVRLMELRKIADEHAGKFRSPGLTILLRGLQHDLDDDYFAELGRHLKQLRFRGGELMSAELGRDNSAVGYLLRSGQSRRKLAERAGIARRTVYSFTVPLRDDAGAEALSAMTNRALNPVANAAAQSADHVYSYFAMLRAELGFYLGCLNLHHQLAARHAQLSFPDPAPGGQDQLSGLDLRDTCLMLRTDRVTGNDVSADGKPLLIITGANSGGKSTFLRSVGVAYLMMHCGLFVTARSFRASVCAGIFTHFLREEDPSLVSGRLDAELKRLSSIVNHLTPTCLILFNESFAATNEREGSEIARQVVTALLEAKMRICFVTHQFDLADGFYQQEPDYARFLRAPRQAEGQRTFRLEVAAPLPTSYGGDIYRRIGGWLGETS